VFQSRRFCASYRLGDCGAPPTESDEVMLFEPMLLEPPPLPPPDRGLSGFADRSMDRLAEKEET
jgi:hypothetical protein